MKNFFFYFTCLSILTGTPLKASFPLTAEGFKELRKVTGNPHLTPDEALDFLLSNLKAEQEAAEQESKGHLLPFSQARFVPAGSAGGSIDNFYVEFTRGLESQNYSLLKEELKNSQAEEDYIDFLARKLNFFEAFRNEIYGHFTLNRFQQALYPDQDDLKFFKNAVFAELNKRFDMKREENKSFRYNMESIHGFTKNPGSLPPLMDYPFIQTMWGESSFQTDWTILINFNITVTNSLTNESFTFEL